MGYHRIRIIVSGDAIRKTALANYSYYYDVRATNFYYTFLKELKGVALDIPDVDHLDSSDPLYFLIRTLIYELSELVIGNVRMFELGIDYVIDVEIL